MEGLGCDRHFAGQGWIVMIELSSAVYVPDYWTLRTDPSCIIRMLDGVQITYHAIYRSLRYEVEERIP